MLEPAELALNAPALGMEAGLHSPAGQRHLGADAFARQAEEIPNAFDVPSTCPWLSTARTRKFV